jgi:hypothetical protein
VVDSADVLERLLRVPVSEWNYKSEDAAIRHIGPMAQDFHAAFGLGGDTTINTLDSDGVALAAIQALAARNLQLEREMAGLRARLEALERSSGHDPMESR